MVERSHPQLKDTLKAHTAGADWPSHLPWVLLGLRIAPKEDSSISSAELLYAAPLALHSGLSSLPWSTSSLSGSICATTWGGGVV